MKFLAFLAIGGAMAAEQNKNRPVEKKIKHLEINAPKMVDQFFKVAPQNPNNPAHSNGPIEGPNTRERVANRLKRKMLSLATVVSDGVEKDCVAYGATARSTRLERFNTNEFKKGYKQVLKNYLRLRENLHEDTKPCKKVVRKITRKVKRYDSNLRTKYCKFIYNEEFCGEEYEYTLDDRVTNRNPHEALKQ